MRLAILSIALILGGCASDAARHCNTLAGSSWALLSRPPDNAEALLAMEGIPYEGDIRWYGIGEDRVMACVYAGSLTNPGCGAATVYEYKLLEGRWSFRHMAMQNCPPQF
jgi:hypothetical protein